MKIILEKLHPALADDPDKPVITYNTLLDEMMTAKAYGFEAYWSAPRDWRLLMYGAERTRDVIQTLAAYDAKEAMKRNNK